MSAESDLADRFFGDFYRHRAPETAAAAMVGFLEHPPHNVRQVARMLVRAAQLDDGVRAAFAQLSHQRVDLAQRINGILETAENPSFPDPATAPLREPSDLDFQWSEFILTGDAAPVERVAAVVRRPDQTLAALVEWSGGRARLPWSRRARRAAQARLQALGFSLDTTRADLGNTLDLDLAVWKNMSDGVDMREILPFTLSDDRIDHLMMKGSACWSLQSNAVPHAAVRLIYDQLEPTRLPQFT